MKTTGHKVKKKKKPKGNEIRGKNGLTLHWNKKKENAIPGKHQKKKKLQ